MAKKDKKKTKVKLEEATFSRVVSRVGAGLGITIPRQYHEKFPHGVTVLVFLQKLPEKFPEEWIDEVNLGNEGD